MRYAVIAACLILAAVGFCVPAYTVHAEVNICTGSRRGHLELPTGIRLRRWSTTSALEQRLRRIPGVVIDERWVSYCGTGKSLFGCAVLFSHGSPGAILGLSEPVLLEWLPTVDDARVVALYRKLHAPDDATRTAAVGLVFDEVVSASGTAAPGLGSPPQDHGSRP